MNQARPIEFKYCKSYDSVALITDFKNEYVLLDTGSVWAQDKLLQKLAELNIKPEQINVALTWTFGSRWEYWTF